MRFSGLVAALLAIGSTAAAQAPDTLTRPRWVNGLSVGVPGGGAGFEPVLFTFGGTFTRVGRGLGPEFSLLTIPRVLPFGALPIIGRVGLAASLTSDGNTYLVPSAGVIAGAVVASGGGAATGGAYAGLAFLAVSEHGAGFRAAYSLNGLGGEPISHLEVGLVWRSKR